MLQTVGIRGDEVWIQFLNVGLRIRNRVSCNILRSNLVITSFRDYSMKDPGLCKVTWGPAFRVLG